MKTVAIICEYNPFHNGHMRQIEKIRDRFEGEDVCILALMSGNFVQRGDIAVLPKEIRAKIAVCCGVDLVLELPYPVSGATAEIFARGAVEILNHLNVDYICFGSECGSIEDLDEAASNIDSERFQNALSQLLAVQQDMSVSYAKTRERIYEELFGNPLLTTPNDILAIEYIRAIKSLDSKIKPFVILREGDESATEARRAYIEQDFELLQSLVPGVAYEIMRQCVPVSLMPLSEAIILKFRLAGIEDFEGIAEFPKGFASRMIKAANNNRTLEKMFDACATKKYTNARIRRLAIGFLVGTTEELLKQKPAYTNLLACNSKGREALGNINFPVLSKKTQYKKYGITVTEQAKFSMRADSIYEIADKNPRINAPYVQ